MLEDQIKELEVKLNYQFKNKLLLKTALTHKSFFHDKAGDAEIKENNERLEFLGDAVLELIVTDYLFATFKDSEGYLTSLRSALVNYRCIGEVGEELGLNTAIQLSKAERGDLGQAKLGIVADAVEALIGAIYLDAGYQQAKDFIEKFVLPKLKNIIDNKTYRDAKTEIQELVQRELKITPRYKILISEGKDHEKTFQVGLYIHLNLLAKGQGKSKQEAETAAAQNCLNQINSGDLDLKTLVGGK